MKPKPWRVACYGPGETNPYIVAADGGVVLEAEPAADSAELAIDRADLVEEIVAAVNARDLK
jgi:hypothetical protein